MIKSCYARFFIRKMYMKSCHGLFLELLQTSCYAKSCWVYHVRRDLAVLRHNRFSEYALSLNLYTDRYLNSSSKDGTIAFIVKPQSFDTYSIQYNHEIDSTLPLCDLLYHCLTALELLILLLDFQTHFLNSRNQLSTSTYLCNHPWIWIDIYHVHYSYRLSFYLANWNYHLKIR